MRKIGTMIAMALMVAPAQAGEATQAMVGYIVAEQYCGLQPIKRLLDYSGPRAQVETGMSGEPLITWVYARAEEAAIQLVLERKLGAFCQSVEQMYRGLQ